MVLRSFSSFCILAVLLHIQSVQGHRLKRRGLSNDSEYCKVVSITYGSKANTVHVLCSFESYNKLHLDLEPLTLGASEITTNIEITIQAAHIATINIGSFFSWLEEVAEIQNVQLTINEAPLLETIFGPKFSEVSKVRTLNFTGLNLQKIDSQLIRYFTGLAELTVRDNNAAILEIDPVIGQRESLKRINLIGCKLKAVPYIDCSHKSREINLENNYITDFDHKIFEKMFRISKDISVNLHGNPISCDNSWEPILWMLKSFDYMQVSLFASCVYPRSLNGKQVTSLKFSDLAPRSEPRAAETGNTNVGILGNHLSLPCELDPMQPGVPIPFKEWSFLGSTVEAFDDEIIYTSPDVLWAEIDNDGCLIVQIKQINLFLDRSLKVPEPFTCSFFNNAGKGEIILNTQKLFPLAESNKQRNQTETQKILPQNLTIFGLSALFLVLFFALIGCSICVWRLRKRPKQPKVKARSLARPRSRQSTVTRYSESGSFQPEVFQTSVGIDRRRVSMLQPTPEDHQGSQHSSPTNSYTSQLEWDPQNDPAAVYCERAITSNPKYQHEVKMNAIGNRSKTSSRLYSSSSERNV